MTSSHFRPEATLIEKRTKIARFRNDEPQFSVAKRLSVVYNVDLIGHRRSAKSALFTVRLSLTLSRTNGGSLFSCVRYFRDASVIIAVPNNDNQDAQDKGVHSEGNRIDVQQLSWEGEAVKKKGTIGIGSWWGLELHSSSSREGGRERGRERGAQGSRQ